MVLVLLSGCGTVKSRSATEQLIVSDAVDRAVAQIDFGPLAGTTAYLDTRYVKEVKGTGFVNADYILSSLRQQMTAARCLLVDKPEDAQYVVEVRVGALGSNDHEMNYGIPANGAISSASSLVTTVPAVPAIPEISLAKKNELLAVAKLAIFAYDRQTKQAVWQSGLSRAESKAKATWVLGAGPFERGDIFDKPQFAGSALPLRGLEPGEDEPGAASDVYYQTRDFRRSQIARLPASEAPQEAETR